LKCLCFLFRFVLYLQPQFPGRIGSPFESLLWGNCGIQHEFRLRDLSMHGHATKWTAWSKWFLSC
jgi:hypothetical protein